MIIKQAATRPPSPDPRIRAGDAAEQRLAFYLHRAFASDPDLLVLNDLRLVDPEQRECDGSDGVCQIDHLVLHRWGGFIIESKSVADTVTVRDDSAGGDEWTRRYGGRDYGFPSPVQQAKLQCAFLRTFLAHHKQELLGRQPKGLRTLSRLLAGTDQRGFLHMPMQIVIAISDNGNIERADDWEPSADPFRTFVSKADLVPGKVRDEFDKHRESGSLLSGATSPYGLWIMKSAEVLAVAGFLAERHQPRTRSTQFCGASDPAERLRTAREPGVATSRGWQRETTCKTCGGCVLTAKWGRYGYYWKCLDCGATTSIPTTCPRCGGEGCRGGSVRIRKHGPNFYRLCAKCGTEEHVWTNPS